MVSGSGPILAAIHARWGKEGPVPANEGECPKASLLP